MVNLLTYLRLTRGESHRYVVALALILGLVLWGLVALRGSEQSYDHVPAECRDISTIPSDKLDYCADKLDAAR
jgi:hypothetical protein